MFSQPGIAAQQRQKLPYGDMHSSFENRVVRTCFLKKGSPHLGPNPIFKPQNSWDYSSDAFSSLPELLCSEEQLSAPDQHRPLAHLGWPCCQSQELPPRLLRAAQRGHLTSRRGKQKPRAKLNKAFTFFSLPCMLYKLNCHWIFCN